MLFSLPLSRHALETYENLMENCEHSVQTHRLYEYSQVLQNIRQTRDCKTQVSVETCDGYQAVYPYTDFLKYMESHYRCSGFCYKAMSGDFAGANTSSLASSMQRYPPTLFSDANYQASCEGMAARDMKNFTGDIGYQTFYQGIYLVLIAVTTGFLKLIGFCVKKDHSGTKQGL